MTTSAELDRIVEGWGTRKGLSAHTRLALAAGGDLGPEEPVPGCTCPHCITYRAGGDVEDADITAFIVQRLAKKPPEERKEAAWDIVAAWNGVGCTLPSPNVLVLLARRIPGAVRSAKLDGSGLPVEEARRVPILDVVRRLGLGEPTRPYPSSRELRVRCPLHPDSEPSLTLSPDEGDSGLCYCFVCAKGGDGIWLVERARGIEFPEAVNWITNGGGRG